MDQGEYCDCKDCRGKYTLIQDEEDPRVLKFDKPLPCFGCGIGWCSLLLGCLCPLLWYVAALLYFCKYYNRDPRERDGLVACVFAALICTVATCITIAVIFL
ncbi:uncharacterized protein LOC110025147 [Phalaenopsis equestris]|uniref:uncharacterized protein LOC110025147 n=1 Tax=Phalaenopsis equestris TaxID=78828 RepID=UPI0009E3AE86|nr:uncharacterized protein LOC110025147 [Phalaenopsis equestris]